MTATYRPKVEEILKKHPDGVSTTDIAAQLGKDPRSIYKALKRTPLAYVDRWASPVRGQYVAIWVLMQMPEDCPHPTRGTKPEKPQLKIETTWR